MTSNFESFKEKANILHNNKYDYSKFIYKNAKTPGIITCPESGHGEFLQKPDHHTRKNAIGCPRCVNINKTKTCLKNKELGLLRLKPNLSLEKYKARLKSKYGNKFEFEYSKYEGITKGTVTLICTDHGEEIHTPQSLLISSFGCTKCADATRIISKTKSFESLKNDVIKVHGNRYEISEIENTPFINRKSIVKVVCSIHGEFLKSGQKLLSGQGCFKCKMEELVFSGKLPGGYSKTVFESNPELANSKAFLYYLCINSKFYKIGVTTSTVERRIQGIRCKSKGYIKNVDIIYVFETTLERAFNLEQSILTRFSEQRISRRWNTELFKTDVLNKHIPTST